MYSQIGHCPVADPTRDPFESEVVARTPATSLAVGFWACALKYVNSMLNGSGGIDVREVWGDGFGGLSARRSRGVRMAAPLMIV